jgi:hypothetical protein
MASKSKLPSGFAVTARLEEKLSAPETNPKIHCEYEVDLSLSLRWTVVQVPQDAAPTPTTVLRASAEAPTMATVRTQDTTRIFMVGSLGKNLLVRQP